MTDMPTPKENEIEITSKQAVKELARVLYEEIGEGGSWASLSTSERSDFYDAILLLSDCEIWWRAIFDNPDDDPVSGCTIEVEA